MPRIFPGRQWKSNLSAFSGEVAYGSFEDAVEQIPYPGSHLTAFSFPNQTLSVGAPMSAAPVIQPAGARVTLFILTPNLPAGLTFNSSTGVISGTPTAPFGTAQFRMQVNAATSYFTTFTLSVS